MEESGDMKRISGNGGIENFTASVSVVVPTFNEKENIAQLIGDICKRLDGDVENFEVIVVDDSSFDGTPIIVKTLAEKNGYIKLVCRPKRMGLGSAVMDGVRHSRCQVIVPVDADFSHPPYIISTLVREATKFDVVVGSRYTIGGKMKAPFMRIVLSRALNFFIRGVLGLRVRDCTGGFMAIRRDVFHSLSINGKSGDYAFELLYKAQKMGFRIVEVPFVYEYRKKGHSKTSIIGYGIRYMLSALSLRVNGRCLV
jgi:dolichol-phosphate mannosyltransferase